MEDEVQGILTEKDRRYLRERPTLKPATDAQKRYRIRKRIDQSISDSELLLERLDEHDRDLVFDEADDEERLTAAEFFLQDIDIWDIISYIARRRGLHVDDITISKEL